MFAFWFHPCKGALQGCCVLFVVSCVHRMASSQFCRDRSRSRSSKRRGGFYELCQRKMRAFRSPWPERDAEVEGMQQQGSSTDYAEWPSIQKRYVPVVRDASELTWSSGETGIVQDNWTYGWDHFLMTCAGDRIWHRESKEDAPGKDRWTRWKRHVYDEEVAAEEEEYPKTAHMPVMEDAMHVPSWDTSHGTNQKGQKEHIEDDMFLRGWAYFWRSPDGNVLWHEEEASNSLMVLSEEPQNVVRQNGPSKTSCGWTEWRRTFT